MWSGSCRVTLCETNMRLAMNKVLVSTSSFGKHDSAPLDKLKTAGLDVELNPYGRKLTLEETIALYQDKIGVIAGTEPITDEVISQAKGLRVISRCGTGMDNVDFEAAKKHGIIVVNTPDGPTLAVVELTVGFILALLRKICEMDRDIRCGVWKKKMGNLLAGKDVGIIGYGRIGQSVGKVLMAMGCRVRFADTVVKSCPLGCECVPFEEIFSRCDIICLHVSGDYTESPLIGKNEISKMKKGALIVNCARGGAIDEEALYEALKNGGLGGVALDVFAEEPYRGKLGNLPNTILTPHIGSYAMEARIAMELQSVDNLIENLA